MSAAAVADAPAPKGKKKLLVIVAAAVVVLLLAGVGAVLMLKKSPSDDEEASAPSERAAAAKARDPKTAPVFSPLEPFIVNLADTESDRYAQVGITLELADSDTEASLKTFMPAVRNNILMLLAHKTSTELLERDGKDRLAREVAREVARGLGIEVEGADADDEEAASSRKKRKKRVEPELPITAVYFSTFIIQ